MKSFIFFKCFRTGDINGPIDREKGFHILALQIEILVMIDGSKSSLAQFSDAVQGFGQFTDADHGFGFFGLK